MKQESFEAPGMQEHHKDISDAGYALADAKDDVKAANVAKKERETALIAAMKKHGKKVYKDKGLGLTVTLNSKDAVSVKRKNAPSDRT